MTKTELVDLMRGAWTGNPTSGVSGPLDADGNPTPLTSKQVAMIDAQLGAVADGIIAALAGGVPGSSPEWVHPQLGAGAAGSVFTLPYAPISVPGVLILMNGQVLSGWTLSGRTLTLPEAKTAEDELFAHYQAIILG